MEQESTPILATCGNEVRAYTLEGKEIPIPEDEVQNNGNPTLIKWYPNGRLLAIAYTNGKIVFHHHEKLQVIGHFNAATETTKDDELDVKASSILSFDVTNGSRFLAAGTNTGKLNIWDMKTGNIVNNFHVKSNNHGNVIDVAFQQTTDARYVACAIDSEIYLYSRASNRLVDTFTVGNSKVTNVAFSPHAVSLLAVTDDSGNLNVWDISRTHASRNGGNGEDSKIDINSTYSRFTSSLGTCSTCLSFTCSKSTVGLLVGNLDKQIRVYDKLLKRCVFSIPCEYPITSIAYCWNDTHVAVGHSNGEISILSVSYIDKSSKTLTHLPSSQNNSSTSLAITSIQFQPKLSAGSDAKTNPLTERLSKRSHSTQNITDSTPFRAAIRANTSPITSTGLLFKTPERSKDDSFPQRRMRDSDLFSPVVRLPQNNSRINEGYQNDSSRAVDYPDDLVIPEFNSTSNGFNTDNNDLPSVVDRRMSDIIPMSSSVQVEPSEYSRYEYTENEVVLDSDAVDELLSPPVPTTSNIEKLEEDNIDDDGDEDDDFIGATKVADESISNGDNSTYETPRISNNLEKKTSLPRGIAFSRMKKSASEVGQRKLTLPPRPPRSSTLPKSTKKVVVDARDTNNEESGEISDISNIEVGGSVTEKQKRTAINQTIPTSERKSSLTTTNLDTTALADTVRQTIIAEMDPIRQDIRADVLNFHTELVLSFSRQTREIEQMFIRQKKEIDELRSEIVKLRKENTEMREMYME